MRSAIFTTSTGYSLEKVILFLKSLENNFEGILVLFTDKKYEYKPKSYKIEYVLINKSFKKLNTINNERLFWYQSYLNDNTDINKVLLSDIRDVIFQKDPFSAIINSKLQVAVEDQIMENCKYNSAWIKMLYGDDYYDSIKKNRIFCSGTILGERTPVVELISFMVEELTTHGPRLDMDSNNAVLDQGIFNYYCNSYPDKVQFHTNYDGMIFTMGYSIASTIINTSFQFTNSRSEIYPIIHQYDRFNWIMNVIESKYSTQSIKNVRVYKDKVKLLIKILTQ